VHFVKRDALCFQVHEFVSRSQVALGNAILAQAALGQPMDITRNYFLMEILAKRSFADKGVPKLSLGTSHS
jgi:hypothetical protein